MKPTREIASLVTLLNASRAHFYKARIGYAPYVDEELERVDEAVRVYLESLYKAYDDDIFQNLEKAAWECVLQEPQEPC